jgi:hypothetical protein
VEKCGGARKATDDNTAHALCMLSKAICAHPPTEICDNYCFSAATMVFMNATQCYVLRTLCEL